MNGWTLNDPLRQSIVSELNFDILCINETHLKGRETIKINGFKWIGHNRTITHVGAPKVFGGTGILVREELFNKYSITTIDNTEDGILGVQFHDKQSEFRFIIFSCYSPPEGSTYANATNLSGHLLSQMYLYHDADSIFICGDCNGSTGNLSDVTDLDNLPSRVIVDNVVRGHGVTN